MNWPRVSATVTERYGPIAFGMVCLLVLHYTIIAPAAERLVFAENTLMRATDAMRDITANNVVHARLLQSAVDSIDRIERRLTQGERP